MSTATVATTVRERPILFSSEMVKAILAGKKTQTRRVMNPQPEPFVQATPDRHPLKHESPYIDSYCSEPKTAANPRGMSTTWCWWTRDDRQGAEVGRCRYGVPGDRLWIREAWRGHDLDGGTFYCCYRADGLGVAVHVDRWTPALKRACRVYMRAGGSMPGIHMPRFLSRLTLEVTEVRVQRLQEISEEDARAEGVLPLDCIGADQPILDTVRGRTHGSHPHVLAYAVAWDTLNGKRAPWASNPWVWVLGFKRLA